VSVIDISKLLSIIKKGRKIALIFCKGKLKMVDGATDSLLEKALRGSRKACKSSSQLCFRRTQVSKSQGKTMLLVLLTLFHCMCPPSLLLHHLPTVNLMKELQSKSTEEIHKIALTISNSVE
jgi:hypothetical protein